MKSKSGKSKIICIYGNSGNGKTELAKSKLPKALYLNCNIENALSMLSYMTDVKELFKYDYNKLFKILNIADPRIEKLAYQEDGSSNIPILFKLYNSEKFLTYEQARPSKRYILCILIILLIRNNKSIILDDLDLLFTGSNFINIIKVILKEIEIGKREVVLTFTNLSLYQLFCLNIKKETEKSFLITKFNYSNYNFEHLEITYNQLAFTISMLYDKEIKNKLQKNELKDDTKITNYPSDTMIY